MIGMGSRVFSFGAAAILAAGLGVAPAEARYGRNAAVGAGIAAGIIGGIAAGAILAQPRRAYGSPVSAYADPTYVEDEPVYVRSCRTIRRRVWLDDATYTYRRVRVCD